MAFKIPSVIAHVLSSIDCSEGAVMSAAYVVRANPAKRGIEVQFQEKPSRDVIDTLKYMKFRWGGTKLGYWFRPAWGESPSHIQDVLEQALAYRPDPVQSQPHDVLEARQDNDGVYKVHVETTPEIVDLMGMHGLVDAGLVKVRDSSGDAPSIPF